MLLVQIAFFRSLANIATIAVSERLHMIYHSRAKLQQGRSNLDSLSDEEVAEEFLDVVHVGIRYLNPKALSNTEKLSLYAYYKQATQGDTAEDPPSLDQESAIKHLFWKNLRGMSRIDAQRKYLETYARLRQKLHVDKELPEIEELLLNSIIPTRHRNAWLQEGYPSQSLRSFKTPHYTTLYPDQLPAEMAHAYAANVGLRYKHTIIQRYLLDRRATRPHTPIHDDQFQFFLTATSYAKLIFPLSSIEAAKRRPYLRLFAPVNRDGPDNGDNGDNGDSADNLYIMDTTPMRALPIRAQDGCYIGPAVVCLRRDPEKDTLQPIAIAIENIHDIAEAAPQKRFPQTLESLTVVYPDHGLAWEMAKLYVLQGADYTVGLGRHVILHISLMNPIALALEQTLRQCGTDSVYGRILKEHTYLLLATNSFVLHSAYSVLWPDYKRQPYDAFCCTADVDAGDNAGDNADGFDDLGGAFELAKLMLSGWEGHPFFTQVDDVELLHNTAYVDGIGPYRAFLRRIKHRIDAFIGAITTVVGEDARERHFEAVFREQLRLHLPECSKLADALRPPSPEDTSEDIPDTSISAIISYVICNGIEHAIDHFHTAVAADYILARIRKPIAFDDRNRDLSYIHATIGGLNTISDRANYYLLNEITKKSIPIKTYGDLFFKEGGYFSHITHERREELIAHERQFAADMSALCAASGRNHLEFYDIATSIQF